MDLADLIERQRPGAVEPEADAGALEQDRVGRDLGIGAAQRAVADAVADQPAEQRLVGVAAGDQLAPAGVAEGADLGVGDEGGLRVQAVEVDVLADGGGELQRRRRPRRRSRRGRAPRAGP